MTTGLVIVCFRGSKIDGNENGKIAVLSQSNSI